MLLYIKCLFLGILAPNARCTISIGIDYNESTQPAKFELKTSENTFSLTIKASVGEMIQPILLSEGEFTAAQSNYFLNSI